MRKTLLSPTDSSSAGQGYERLDLAQAARVEVSSEAEGYPIEGALLKDVQGGWRASEPGIRPFGYFLISRRQFGSFRWFSKKKSLPALMSLCCDGCRREHGLGKTSSGSSGPSVLRLLRRS